MPLIQEILSQQTVVIILALIGVLIFATFAVVVFAQIRQMQRRHARRRERQVQIVKARRAALVTSTDIEEGEDVDVVVVGSATAAAEIARTTTPKVKHAPVQTAPLVEPPAAVPAAAESPTDAAATTEQPTEPAQPTPEDAMASLLSDVFSDEETSGKKEALLVMTESIDIRNLTNLTKEIADQLGLNEITGAAV